MLMRLVAAGVITRAQADEIMTQYNLGGEAKKTVLKRLRTLLQEEKAEQGFTQMLKRLVGASILTQAQADEALAQFNLGGDAKESVIKRIRALLQDKKDDGDKKREQKKPAAGAGPQGSCNWQARLALSGAVGVAQPRELEPPPTLAPFS